MKCRLFCHAAIIVVFTLCGLTDFARAQAENTNSASKTALSPEAQANRAFVSALKYIGKAKQAEQAGNTLQALGDYLNAGKVLVTIPNKFPESPIAVDLMQGKTLLQGMPVGDLFAQKIPSLTTAAASKDLFFLGDILWARYVNTNKNLSQFEKEGILIQIEVDRKDAWTRAATNGEFATARKLFEQGLLLAYNFEKSDWMPNFYSPPYISAIALFESLPPTLATEQKQAAARWTLDIVNNNPSGKSPSLDDKIRLATDLLKAEELEIFSSLPKEVTSKAASVVCCDLVGNNSQPEKAAEAVRKYLRFLTPDDYKQVNLELGEALEKAGKSDQAKAVFQKVWDYDRDNLIVSTSEPDWHVGKCTFFFGVLPNTYFKSYTYNGLGGFSLLDTLVEKKDFETLLKCAENMPSYCNRYDSGCYGNMQRRGFAYIVTLLEAGKAGDITNALKAADAFIKLFNGADEPWKKTISFESDFWNTVNEKMGQNIWIDVIGQAYNLRALIDKIGNENQKQFFHKFANSCEAATVRAIGVAGLNKIRADLAAGKNNVSKPATVISPDEQNAKMAREATNVVMLVSCADAITNDLARFWAKNDLYFLPMVLTETNPQTAKLAVAWIKEAEDLYQRLSSLPKVNPDGKYNDEKKSVGDVEAYEKNILAHVAKAGVYQEFLSGADPKGSWLWLRTELIIALANVGKVSDALAIYHPFFAPPETPREPKEQTQFDWSKYRAMKAIAFAGEATEAPETLPKLMSMYEKLITAEANEAWKKSAVYLGLAIQALKYTNSPLTEKYLHLFEEKSSHENEQNPWERTWIRASAEIAEAGFFDAALALTNRTKVTLEQDMICLAIARGEQASKTCNFTNLLTALQAIKNPKEQSKNGGEGCFELKTQALLALGRPQEALLAALDSSDYGSMAKCVSKIAGYAVVHPIIWDAAAKARLTEVIDATVGKPEAALPSELFVLWPQ